MPPVWALAAVVCVTAATALLVRLTTRRFDGILLLCSGVASLVLALVASSAMTDTNGAMSFEMSKTSFSAGVLSPVSIVATLTVMRGLFKILGE